MRQDIPFDRIYPFISYELYIKDATYDVLMEDRLRDSKGQVQKIGQAIGPQGTSPRDVVTGYAAIGTRNLHL